MKQIWSKALKQAASCNQYPYEDLEYDYKLINRYSERSNGHQIWTGMITRWGAPRFKCKTFMRLMGTYDRPYQVTAFLHITMNGLEYRPRYHYYFHSMCNNKRCINPAHLTLLDKKLYLSQETIKTLQLLIEKYPLKFLSDYYGINEVTLKRYTKCQ